MQIGLIDQIGAIRLVALKSVRVAGTAVVLTIDPALVTEECVARLLNNVAHVDLLVLLTLDRLTRQQGGVEVVGDDAPGRSAKLFKSGFVFFHLRTPIGAVLGATFGVTT